MRVYQHSLVWLRAAIFSQHLARFSLIALKKLFVATFVNGFEGEFDNYAEEILLIKMKINRLDYHFL